MSRIGLVLEGGAMRGLYTAGVLDVLMENNIEVDSVVGVSAGAAFGCNYKSKQIGRVLRYNVKYAGDSRMGGIGSLLKTGDIYNAEFAYYTLPETLDVFDAKTFEENPSEFYVVTTNIETGEPNYTKLESGTGGDIDWIRASASMPLVSNPVEIDGSLYLDGGITDPIPLAWSKRNLAVKNIVILTQPAGYVKPPEKTIVSRLLRKYPNLANGMKMRNQVYNRSVLLAEEDAKLGNTFLIRPSIDLELKRAEKNPVKLEAMYDLGRYDALANLEQLKQFISDVKEN